MSNDLPSSTDKAFSKSEYRPGVGETMTNPVHLLATGLGSGLSPVAPGTVGSAAAVLLYMLFLAHLEWWAQLAVIVVGGVVGIYLCGKTARDWNTHDHGAIVWDEWVAQWLTLIALPWNSPWLILGFVYFRLFDIWKPWPISWCDRHVHGGAGIMLDDILAGGIALLCTRGTMLAFEALAGAAV
ncbi:phosphatidylglycerophosphatase A [Hahella sp. CCB-MM4]|uniref:phosphatidylglycerophosphatase A family protein n=1 Tax=Hahella sp. (strain CCB-MM4) TaxID=1926491 RepID=UPI000B9A7E98